MFLGRCWQRSLGGLGTDVLRPAHVGPQWDVAQVVSIAPDMW
eukprot:CAMPEP_0204033560 /NCGR_PEP_ID=MMETSP0360-20130528/70777_1 /ASSEMBLY_ACC=CAM_ASM_000342 /TAXON_ID=268821 /ORGANISM="Scrippsiella Hangoei, Strain SHTV-5" /LENGTH=41 /DNA_ID= /DNA_START= /DNA_END= /DNA_ORIENTATION=